MTRERLPSGTTMQRAYGVLDKFKISRTFFVKTDQEGCAIAASDINAANGITPTSTIPEAIGVEQKERPTAEELDAKAAEAGKSAPVDKKAQEIVKPQPVAEVIIDLKKESLEKTKTPQETAITPEAENKLQVKDDEKKSSS